jgi:hypothetical protein
MKVKIKKLPKGFKVSNGKVIRSMAEGGNVNNTLGPIDRDNANLEAEKGETALTDLTNDGSFELYNIGGKRHTEGGTPLNLPEQSFVFSDTRKMLLSVEELKSLGIDSKKKMTPAAASKKFPLNKYIEILENESSDKISIDTSEEMINKNKIKLSQIAFLQESKKDFSDGLPLASYPFLISKGINPQELEAKIAEKNGPQQNPSPQMSQEQMAMGPQQGNLQQFTGPPQGGPPQGGPGMPPPEMMQQMMAQQGQGGPPMGKYGTELPSYQKKGEIPADEKMLMEIRKLNLELEEGIPLSQIDSMETVRYMQDLVPRLKKAGFSTWDVIRHLEKNRPDLMEYRDNGALFNIKGWEGVKKSGLPNKQKYGGTPGAGGDVGVCPKCGKKQPCGCKYKMGGDLPKYSHHGETAKGIIKGIKNWKIPKLPTLPNKINPMTFKPLDNWLISRGGVSNDMITTKFNLGDQNLGLHNAELMPKTGLLQGGNYSVSETENVKVWPGSEGYGVSTQLYDKSIESINGQIGEGENFMTGLISGNQKVNPMESPEKTIGMWKYFDKEVTELKGWSTDKDKLWTVANDVDFSQYLKMGEDGIMTYTGPEVRLTGLNEAGSGTRLSFSNS